MPAAHVMPAQADIQCDPFGNRVYKKSTAGVVAGERKYIVDVGAGLPVVLLEIDPSDSSLKNSYIYADGQILAQYDGDPRADPPAAIYFYLHDRLGSVRQVIDDTAAVVNHYTYEPYGRTLDSAETVTNPWRFTGQYYDAEIEEYHLRARQYNPFLARFTARDPVWGKFREPLTLQKYLYCGSDPVNRLDLGGEEFSLTGFTWNMGINATLGAIEAAYKGDPTYFWASIVGGLTSEGIGAWALSPSVSGLVSKVAVGMAKGAAASVGGDIAKRAITGDWDNWLADATWSAAFGAALGGLGGVADYKEWFEDNGELSLYWEMVGSTANTIKGAVDSRKW